MYLCNRTKKKAIHLIFRRQEFKICSPIVAAQTFYIKRGPAMHIGQKIHFQIDTVLR